MSFLILVDPPIPEAQVLIIESTGLVYRNGNEYSFFVMLDTKQGSPVEIEFEADISSTASPSSDYNFTVSSPLVIGAGAQITRIKFTVVDKLEADETLVIKLLSVSGGNGNVVIRPDKDTLTVTLREVAISSIPSTIEQPNKDDWTINRPVSLCTGIEPTRLSALPIANLNGRVCDVLPIRTKPDAIGDDHTDPIISAVELCGISTTGETDSVFNLGSGTAAPTWSGTDFSKLLSLYHEVEIFPAEVGVIQVPVFDTSHPNCHLVETRKDGNFVKEKTFYSTFSKVVPSTGELVHFGGVTTIVTYYSGTINAYRISMDYENSVYNHLAPEGNHAPHSDQAGSFAIRYWELAMPVSVSDSGKRFRVLADHADASWNPSLTNSLPKPIATGNFFRLVQADGTKYQPLPKKGQIPTRHFTLYQEDESWDQAFLINQHGQYSRCYNGVFDQSARRWYGPFESKLPVLTSTLNLGTGVTGRAAIEEYFGNTYELGRTVLNNFGGTSAGGNGVGASGTEDNIGLVNGRIRRGYHVAFGAFEDSLGGRRWITQSVGEFNTLGQIKYYRMTGTYNQPRNAMGLYTPEGKIITEKMMLDSEGTGKAPWSNNDGIATFRMHPHFAAYEEDRGNGGSTTFEPPNCYSRTSGSWNAIPLAEPVSSSFTTGIKNTSPLVPDFGNPGYNFAHLCRAYIHYLPLAYLVNDGWANRRLRVMAAHVQSKFSAHEAQAIIHKYGYHRNNLYRMVEDLKNMPVDPAVAGATGVKGEAYLYSQGHGWSSPPTSYLDYGTTYSFPQKAMYRHDGHAFIALHGLCLVLDPEWREYTFDTYAPKIKEFIDYHSPETGISCSNIHGDGVTYDPDGAYTNESLWGVQDLANLQGAVSVNLGTGQNFWYTLVAGGVASLERVLGLTSRPNLGPSANTSVSPVDVVKRVCLVGPHLQWAVQKTHPLYTPGMHPPSFSMTTDINVTSTSGVVGMRLNPNFKISEYKPWKLNRLSGYRTAEWTDKERGGLVAYLTVYEDSGFPGTEFDTIIEAIGTMFGDHTATTVSAAKSLVEAYPDNSTPPAQNYHLFDVEITLAALQNYL